MFEIFVLSNLVCIHIIDYMSGCDRCGLVTVRDSGECSVMVVCEATVTVLWSEEGGVSRYT